MKLLIDFGNSRSKWANLEYQDLRAAKAYIYKSAVSTQRVREVVERICFDSIQEIHVVSVLGEVFEKQFSSEVKKIAGIDTKFHVSQANSFGVMLAYANPLTYGADRYAALIAAHHKESGAKIVIDCGTATTVDVINANGQHRGGLIIPGIQLMCSALANKASGINLPKQANSSQLFNDNTADAVYSGSALVLSHGVNGIIQQIVSKINEPVIVYVTGGESHMMAHADVGYVECPHLVLEGLQIMQG
jgi:type III pantothenate kinase